jgi:hypothetical protein
MAVVDRAKLLARCREAIVAEFPGVMLPEAGALHAEVVGEVVYVHDQDPKAVPAGATYTTYAVQLDAAGSIVRVGKFHARRRAGGGDDTL